MSFPKYPEYKDSGVEWLGEVPAHWDIKPLKYVATYNDEVLPENTSDDYRIKYVEISDINEQLGITGWSEHSFSSAPSRARRVLKDGDVLVSTVRTYLRAIAPVKEPPENLVGSTGFAAIRPVPGVYHSALLGYTLRAEWFISSVIARSVGVSYPAINASDLVALSLPVPPWKEQKSIATFLDHETARIDALVEEQQRLIELLKEKRQAVISNAVTKGLDPDVPMKDSGVEWLGEVPAHWEVGRVKNAASFITSGPRGWSDYLTESGEEIFVQSGDLDFYIGVNFENAKRIRSPMGAEGARTRINCGDVLVCITGANTGRVAVSGLPPVSAFINQHLSLVRLNQVNTLPEFVGYALSSESIQSFFRVEQYGLKEGLSLGDVADAPLVLPPKYEQELVMKYLKDQTQRLDRLAIDAERSVELLQERRSALISAAVTGKIDVRGWQPPEVSLAHVEAVQMEGV